MKTAGRENPNRWAHVFINRARGAAGQNPCLFKWAAKQEKLQSLEELFFLTSPFIELFSESLCQACHRLRFCVNNLTWPARLVISLNRRCLCFLEVNAELPWSALQCRKFCKPLIRFWFLYSNQSCCAAPF